MPYSIIKCIIDVIIKSIRQFYLGGVEEFNVLGLRAFGEGDVVVDIAIIKAALSLF